MRIYVRISCKNSCKRNPLRSCVTCLWGNRWSSLCLKEKCNGACSLLIPLSHSAETFQWRAVELQILLNFSSAGPASVFKMFATSEINMSCTSHKPPCFAVLERGAGCVFHCQSPLTHFVFSSINLFLSMFSESNPAQPPENKAIV